MPLIVNGTTIENAIYNGTTLEKIIFNGTEVFSAGFTLNVTISSNTTNYNIASAATALGWDGVKKLKGTITINSGVYVYSTSTGTPAFSTGTIPSGSDVTVVNNGTIVGKGGNGGNGATFRENFMDPGFPGGSGGLGFYATSAIKVTNNGRIAGGGGGGGGAAYPNRYADFVPTRGGGGGIGNGSGGTTDGGSGTLSSAGAGAARNNFYVDDWLFSYGEGGNGGSYGSAGASAGASYLLTGITYAYGGTPGSGGGAGAAVVGTSNITWNATGTRNGAIS